MNRKSALALILIFSAVEFNHNAWAGKNEGACMGSLMNSGVAQSEFQHAAMRLLTSVKERDFRTFEQFFREDLDFTAVLPGGKTINDLPTFMASQSSWFKGTTGSFDFSIKRTEVSADLGSAHAIVDYKNVDATGKPFELEIYISFLFRKVDGKWFLVHDQNTVLREVK